MGKRSKKKKTVTEVKKAPRPTPLVIGRAVLSSLALDLNAVVVGLSVTHVFLALMLLAMAANYHGAFTKSLQFGQEASEEILEKHTEMKEKRGRPISAPVTVGYCAFTGLVWGILLVKRRRFDERILRVLILLLSFGTLVAFYAASQWVMTRP